MEKARLIRRLVPIVFPLVLAVAAVTLLHHQLRNHRLHDILAGLSVISTPRLTLAAALTLVAYVALAGYDCLGLRYLHHRCPSGTSPWPRSSDS